MAEDTDAGISEVLFEDALTADLVNQIATMEPGTRLASERLQAETLGVSRTALRDRLRHLESIGILERRPGAGTFVRGVQTETVSQALALGLMGSNLTVESLRSLRVALERQAAYEAARASDHVSIAHMTVAVERMERVDDADSLHEADVEFHRALFAASCSPALQFFADALQRVLTSSMRRVHLEKEVRTMREVHRAIRDAVADQDPQGAMRAVDDHFAWSATLPRGDGL